MDKKYDPELMRRLREDDDSILCLAAADVIERQDAEIERLKKQLSGERCPECDGELVFVGYVGTNVDHMGEQYDCALCSLRYDLKLAKDSAEKAEALIENLREGNMRLCVIINDNTPPGAQQCTVDLLEQGVEWLCGELRRVLLLARELKAELERGQKP